MKLKWMFIYLLADFQNFETGIDVEVKKMEIYISNVSTLDFRFLRKFISPENSPVWSSNKFKLFKSFIAQPIIKNLKHSLSK